MVHFPGLARTRLCIQRAVARFYRAGFPHSDISGSKPACGSPKLFAACHVLHRLLAPRHPPYALSSLTIKLTPHVAIALHAGLHRSARHRECGQVRLSTPLALPRAELAVFAPRDLSSRNAMPSSFSCQRTPPCTSTAVKGSPLPVGCEAGLEPPPQIKNPASSAGPLRPHMADGFARSLTFFYPVFVTNLTSHITGEINRCPSGPPGARPGLPTFSKYTDFRGFVKCFPVIFWCYSCEFSGRCGKPATAAPSPCCA